MHREAICFQRRRRPAVKAKSFCSCRNSSAISSEAAVLPWTNCSSGRAGADDTPGLPGIAAEIGLSTAPRRRGSPRTRSRALRLSQLGSLESRRSALAAPAFLARRASRLDEQLPSFARKPRNSGGHRFRRLGGPEARDWIGDHPMARSRCTLLARTGEATGAGRQPRLPLAAGLAHDPVTIISGLVPGCYPVPGVGRDGR